MNNPLRYQMTEYDCGPTSMLNAVSYLFQREEIPPEIVRSIMLYCLDCFGADGACGKCGTSCTAMMFLSNWIEMNGLDLFFNKINSLSIYYSIFYYSIVLFYILISQIYNNFHMLNTL